MLTSEGSVIHARHEGSARVLRFRKVYLADRTHGLRLEIPDTPEAQAYGARVRDMLIAAGFTCTRSRRLQPWWPAQERVLVAVDQLTAVDGFRAAEVAREAMGLGQNERYTMHMEGMASLQAGREYRASR